MPISKNDLKNFSALKRKTNREQNQSFIVEGKKSCLELLKSKFKIVATFVTDEKLITEFPNATIISEKDASRLSQLKSHSSVICVAKIPKKNISENNDNSTILFLDSINDPGNLGTIIRTLDWFGFTNLYCSTHSVDVYNSKVIMASMGSVFRVNVQYLNFEELIAKFPNHNIYGTFLNGNNLYKYKIEKNSIVIMGNESNGISSVIEKKVTNRIMIPGSGKAESLNVSTATAIILSEIKRGNSN